VTPAPHLAIQPHAPEWPRDTLDVGAAEAAGWRPVPVREFILKLVGRCNLACDYCYVFEMPDQTWRTRPTFMTVDTVRLAGVRIGEHAASHGLDRVSVVLHGGEPLLAGADGIARVATAIRRQLPAGVHLDLRLQTNGVLLDEPVTRVLHEHSVRVGVSLDGDAAGHDRHRRRADGRGSHAETARALRLLNRPEHRELFAGLLCVVDIDNPPVATYEALLEFDPPSVDFLLPHGNWSQPPPGWTGGDGRTPYAEWLISVFDRWFGAPSRETRVIILEEIVNLLLGGASRSEQVGLSPVAFLVVDTDGTLQQSDTLKSAFPGAPETGLNVRTHAVDDALRHPSVVARQIGLAALADECRACPAVRICGGGHYAHRYRRGSGFRHRSIYGADLYRLIGHIRHRLADRLRSAEC
jgi:uncharacterized protein